MLLQAKTKKPEKRIIELLARKTRQNLFTLVMLIIFILTTTSNIFTQGGSSENQSADTSSNKADSNLRSVARINPSTLAMEFSLPLAVYPGRAGNSIPLSINYSSKTWEIDTQETWWYTTGLNHTRFVTDFAPRFAERSAAGWTSSLLPPRIDQSFEVYNQYGKPFDFFLDLNDIDILYQQQEQNLINGNSQSNLMPSPENCGLVCSSGYVIGFEGNSFACLGWSFVRCHTTWDDVENPPGNNAPPKKTHYIKRVKIQMSGGSMVEFRKDDKIHGYCVGENTSNPINCEGEGADELGDFLAVDGSGMRLNRETSQSTLFMPNGSRYIFDSLPLQSGLQWYATKFIDVNGNKRTFSQTPDSNNNAVNKWVDTFGEEILDPIPHNNVVQHQTVGIKEVDVPGLGVSTRTYKLKWLQLKDKNGGESAIEDTNQLLAYQTKNHCRGSNEDPLPPAGSSNPVLFDVSGSGLRACNPVVEENGVIVGALFNPIVLAEVELPNGLTYTFKYNEYGEISKIIYPSGTYETFDYAQIDPLGSFYNDVYDQTNRGVTERRVYDSDDVLQQRWQYSAGYDSIVITTANYTVTTISSLPTDPMQNGARTERDLVPSPYQSPGSPNGTFGFSDPRAGMPKETRSYDELGQIRSRTITEYVNTPARTASSDPNAIDEPRAVRDPRAIRSVSFIFEPGESYALATFNKTFYDDDGSTDPEFFSHLNVEKTEGYEYAAIPVSQAQSTSNWTTIENWFPTSKLASVTEADYSYDVNYKENGILALPIETRVLNPKDINEVLAKTQTGYDEFNLSNPGATTGYVTPTGAYADKRGNVTTQKLWDDDNQIWINSYTEYDIYGNAVKKTDHLNRVATVEFDALNKFAYPVRTISPAPGDGTNGTTELFKTETDYDFTTGLVIETRDLRSLNDPDDDIVTTTEYVDDLLRPTAVVSGPASVAYADRLRAETIYYDDPNLATNPGGLRVVSRSQFDTNTWNEGIAYADSLGRVYKTRTIDSNGDVFVESKFDFAGRVTEVSNPYREGETNILWSKTEYDEAGRVENIYSPVADPDTSPGDPVGTTEYGIMTANNIIGVWSVSTDASGRKSRSVTNALGQLVRVDEAASDNSLDPIPNSTPNPTPTPGASPSPTPPIEINPCDEYNAIECPNNLTGNGEYPSVSTYYKYNIKGEMVEVTQGNQKRNFLYDSLGRLIRVKQPEQEVNTSFPAATDPVTGNSQWTMRMKYDVMGKVVESEDANGTKINYTYDNADRVLSVTYSDGTPTVTYKYDLIDGNLTSGSKGALIETSNVHSTSKTNAFDQWGRPTEYSQITNVGDQGTPDLQTYTSKYKYNLSGALIEEEYPSGRKVKHEFDPNGDLMRVWGTNGTTNQVFANAFTYTASGGVSEMKLGNGTWETAKFNDRLQVTELGLGSLPTNADLWKVNYEFGEYDPNTQTITGAKNTGNIARQTVSFDGLPNAFVQTYQYDSLYRLTNANEMAGTTQTENWSEKFEYDRYGNRTKKFRDGVEIANNALSHPSIDQNTNRFTSNGYGYDKVGNLTDDAEGRSFVFDGNNKQILVTDVNNQAVGEYFYDGDGMRVKKKIFTGGVHLKTVIFVYSGGKLIEEYATDPPTNPKTKYLTEDHLGTPRVITDGNGQVVSRRDFMPFGEQIANTTGTRSDNSFKYSSNEDDVQQKFTGYQKDGETMLDFAEARMYENRHARFTAVDPLLASGNSANPQTFNRYVYVLNNPLLYTDPNGLCPTGSCPDTYDGKVYSRNDGKGKTWYTDDPTAGDYKWTEIEQGTYMVYDSTTGKTFRIFRGHFASGWRLAGDNEDPSFMIPRRWRSFSYIGAPVSQAGISERQWLQQTLDDGGFENRNIETRKDLEDSGKVTALMNMGQFANLGGMRSSPGNRPFNQIGKINRQTPGEATIYKSTVGDKKHLSIETGGLETQVLDRSGRAVADNKTTFLSPTNKLKVNVPNILGANRFQKNQLKQSDIGKYKFVRNGCFTHVCRTLEAGGVSKSKSYMLTFRIYLSRGINK